MFQGPSHVFSGVSKIDDRGRIVLPRDVRDYLHVKTGEQVMFIHVVPEDPQRHAYLILSAVKPHA